MIYLTADTHGMRARFSEPEMSGESMWTKDDYLIICGDFGFLLKNSKDENDFLDLLEETKPYTICFCDGNHENFPALFSYPQEVWNGGKIHRIRKNIIHLMRGQVFGIDGKSIFVMGGAFSVDRSDRIPGFTYWDEELPCNSEYREATSNLKKHGNEVDIIITHTAPQEVIRQMGSSPHIGDLELSGFLEWVMYEMSFKKWFFGHWHFDRVIDERFHALYKNIVRL